MEKNEPKLVCRKCQGPHLTMNCGKEPKSIIENIIINSYNTDFKSSNYKKDKEDINKSYKNKYERNPVYKVKISNLPINMTEDKLNEFLYNFYDGKYIKAMTLINRDLYSIAFIEFREEEAADYLVLALNKTPYGHIIIDVERLYY